MQFIQVFQSTLLILINLNDTVTINKYIQTSCCINEDTHEIKFKHENLKAQIRQIISFRVNTSIAV